MGRYKKLRIGDKRFLEMQKKWYDKLKEDGFTDIEYRNDFTGDMQTEILKVKTKKFPAHHVEERYHYYNMLRNFITHNERWGSRRSRFVVERYTEGLSYRNIIKESLELSKSKLFKPELNLFSVHKIVHEFIREAFIWNKESVQGLEYPGNLEGILNMLDEQSGE